ncbi:putative protein N(5)-glutamine methyltransferase [Winogradskya consettensis]|nr:putative protein N(5)-glutamine methyltransferase [Actinoplanes consettensis]
MESVLEQVVLRLRSAGCVFAEEEAAMLTGAAPTPEKLEELVERRAQGEPLEQVVGYAIFCGEKIHLRPGVFVPRVRSELLVRIAAENATNNTVVVDLCCGSGALGKAVHRRVPGMALYAADSDPTAVACAKDNIGPENVFQGDLFAALPAHLKGGVNVLIANVPYVATRHIPFLPAEARDHEPREALDGGDDGLDVFRAVLKEAKTWLAPGGILLSEITEAQISTATDVVRATALHPAIHIDEDLEATVVTATALNR